MSDNTTLPTGVGGDTIRTIDRSSDSTPVAAKTQVIHLDQGGELGPEILATPVAPLTVVAVNTDVYMHTLVRMHAQLLATAAPSAAGFIPVENHPLFGM